MLFIIISYKNCQNKKCIITIYQSPEVFKLCVVAPKDVVNVGQRSRTVKRKTKNNITMVVVFRTLKQKFYNYFNTDNNDSLFKVFSMHNYSFCLTIDKLT